VNERFGENDQLVKMFFLKGFGHWVGDHICNGLKKLNRIRRDMELCFKIFKYVRFKFPWKLCFNQAELSMKSVDICSSNWVNILDSKIIYNINQVL
jgi:hypothetical protein